MIKLHTVSLFIDEFANSNAKQLLCIVDTGKIMLMAIDSHHGLTQFDNKIFAANGVSYLFIITANTTIRPSSRRSSYYTITKRKRKKCNGRRNEENMYYVEI